MSLYKNKSLSFFTGAKSIIFYQTTTNVKVTYSWGGGKEQKERMNKRDKIKEEKDR